MIVVSTCRRFALLFCVGLVATSLAWASARSSSARLWKKGVVYYQFDKSINEDTKKIIREVMDTYTQDSPISFLEEKNKKGYVTILLQSPKDKDEANFAGSSILGYQYGGQNLNLVPGHENDPYTIAHELGHVLGLDHEHQRPDRDETIQIDLENVKPEAKSYYKIDRDIVPLGPYDPGSIMQYPQTSAFAVDMTKPIITIKDQPYSSYSPTKPSTADLLGLWKLYSTQKKHDEMKAEFRSRGWAVN